MSFTPGELSAGRDGDYILLDLWTGLSVCARSVTGSLLFGYAHGLICRCFGAIIVPQDRHCLTTVVRKNTPDTCYSRRTWRIEGYLFRSSVIVILIIWYYFGVFRVRDMASDGLLDSEQAGPSYAPSGPLPGTFLGPALDIRSERLYDLAPDIPDVMGLRALRPSAAVVKVMSVRDSRCIRVVTPDDHVACGYHEILLHDMGEEELPFVLLNELDYLRRIWPWTIFAFMTRYQQDLERSRRECKERFGCTQSGNCTHCGKYIQMDLGKHIAFYHLELAQLWRCPVMWCTVWKGTAQDCIDHMWRTHKVPLAVKAANLAKYFPAWTVTRDQWADMLMPCISGVAIDTLLFSRIGSPLCHRYWLISRTGSHAAFRGTYLRRLRTFIEESDSAVGRRLHHRLAQELAARVVTPTVSPASGHPRSPVSHRMVSRPRRRDEV